MATRRTRTLQFFADPDEAREMLRSLGDLGLVIFEADGDAMEQVIDGMYRARLSADGKVEVPTEVYIGEEVVNLSSSATDEPARHGWLQLNLPLVRDGQLLMATLGAVNVWADGETGFQDDRALKTFATVKRQLVKSLAASAVVFSRLPNGGEAAVPRIRLTEGAIRWWTGGGELVQDGVLNNLYRPHGESS